MTSPVRCQALVKVLPLHSAQASGSSDDKVCVLCGSSDPSQGTSKEVQWEAYLEEVEKPGF